MEAGGYHLACLVDLLGGSRRSQAASWLEFAKDRFPSFLVSLVNISPSSSSNAWTICCNYWGRDSYQQLRLALANLATLKLRNYSMNLQSWWDVNEELKLPEQPAIFQDHHLTIAAIHYVGKFREGPSPARDFFQLRADNLVHYILEALGDCVPKEFEVFQHTKINSMMVVVHNGWVYTAGAAKTRVVMSRSFKPVQTHMKISMLRHTVPEAKNTSGTISTRIWWRLGRRYMDHSKIIVVITLWKNAHLLKAA
ncbi:hypothetical protein SELMODRAFT_407324 [Selaginella moellendorffii]|uniref:Uncharacterized protein n=1 Tax=Selaginella moellendorffii TaxID=88036 RepID=D8R4N7_SELML|nr:hypothetical protein SELMODRAFT_407324 [Selaginella moellendorffii]